MNGKRAKAIRRMVYGDYSPRARATVNVIVGEAKPGKSFVVVKKKGDKEAKAVRIMKRCDTRRALYQAAKGRRSMELLTKAAQRPVKPAK